MTVDLRTRIVQRGTTTLSFDYPDHMRDQVMSGRDEITSTLDHDREIRAFEASRRPTMPEVGATAVVP